MLDKSGLLRTEVVRFFLSTLVGLSVDLGGYGILTAFNSQAGIANLMSSTAAVAVMYVLSGRFTFRSRGGTTTVVLFFAWYAVSILCFSTLIQVAAHSWHWGPLPAKVASLPLSFTANFLTTRLIFATTSLKAHSA